MGMQQESDSDDIEAYCPGLDCAVNTHPALNNLEKMTPIYDDGGLHRSKDPGAGAITPYHNGSTYVNRDIPAGGELFKDYGSSWFNYRWEAFQYLPMWEHYEEAHALLRKWDTLKVRDDTVKADLYSILKGLDVAPRNAEAALHADESSFHSRILAALPSTYRDAKHVLDHDTDIPSLHQDKHVRSIEYLRNHGKCLDHIQNRPSTIPQAGRGAFAVRDLPKGTIISASPLHHVEESFANMYNFSVRPDGSWLRVKDQVVNKQLMLNYCFAHPNSTILLCPYGSSINYINHSRNQTNVRIQWATNFTYGHNHSMVEGPISDLLKTEKPKLAFDYIATRDIKEGDELLLDYGDAWIAAWERHVQNWKPVANADSYTSARLMNLYFPDSILRTELEQQYDPYPPHLELRCHKGLFNAAGKTQFRWTINDVGMPCRVLARDIRKDDGQVLYSVELEYHHGKNKVTRTQRSDVPRHSMAFVDVPFSTDLHLRNAFRHPIGIPDDIFPPQWTNKLLEESDAAAQPGPPGDRATVVDSNTLKDSLLGDNAENDDDYEDDDFSYYNKFVAPCGLDIIFTS